MGELSPGQYSDSPYAKGQEGQREKAAQQAEQERLAEEKRISDLAEQGLNPDGSPVRPEFESQIDPATGLLKSQYQMSVDKLQAGKADLFELDPSSMEGLQAFKKEALREGPSQWAQLQQQMLEQQKGTDLDKAARQAGAAGAQARGSLAMRGGLSSGARERIATGGARDLMRSKQDIQRGSRASGLQLLSDDERNRLAMLSQVPGFETDIGKFNVDQRTGQQQFNIGQQTDADRFNIEGAGRTKAFNIEAALRGIGQERGEEMDIYKEQQKKWAAGKQAEATAASGGGGK